MDTIDVSVPSSLASHHTTNIRPQSHRYPHSNDTTVINNSNHGLLDQDGKVLVDRLIRSAVGINTESHHTATDSQMDAFLAGELNNMSLHERQKIYEEIHGVDQTVQETPEFVAQHLDALDVAISNIYPKLAYDMAEEMNYEYVHNDTFRLTFLRADMFDPIKAAKRLVTFFQCRLALFGPGLLTQNLTLNDLNRDDIACLTSGYFQILPSRDTAGRAVFVNLQGMFKRAYRLALNMQRMYHYLMCSIVEDMETQLRGTVFVMYQIGNFEYDPPPDLFNGYTTLLFEGSPARLCGMHYCLENPVMKSIARVVLAVMGSETRARYRFHEGSHTEVLYRLLSFGIPVDLLPVTADGELKKTNHMKWLTMRKAKEATRSIMELPFASSQNQHDASRLRIDLPGRNDVLMGKGKPLQEHSGNVSMRAVVGLYLPEYSTTPKHLKANYFKKVYSLILSKPARFLKRDPNGWWILSMEEEAVEKIGKTFTSELAKTKRLKSTPKRIVSSEDVLKRPRDDERNCFSDTIAGISCVGERNHWPIFGTDTYHVQKRLK